jgi:L-lactate dehydrogenase complex protein LldG
MSAREAILGRVRAALGNRAGERAADYAAVPRAYRQGPSLDADARVALFEERLRDYGVKVARCANDGVAEAIAGMLRERDVPGVLTPSGFPREWLPKGLEFTAAEGMAYDAIDRADGVITLCSAAIALTGTIILQDLAPGQGPRALSLIPDYHLCIVDAAQIVETVPEAIRAIDARQIRTLTTISGPSATSDIEMTRVRGVHGPRTLEVIIRG